MVRVLTATDLPDLAPTSRARLLLARERVLFVGQPVALVVAESEAAAEDAAPAVEVSYTELPAVTELEAAIADGAPLVWPEGMPGEDDEAAAHGIDVGGEEAGPQRSNLANPVSFRRGDPEAAFAAAHAVVERSYRTSIVHQSYLEPHAVQVDPGSGVDGVTVWSCTQAQFAVRKEVADVLGLPESDVHVKPMPVGGGFGGKFMLYQPLVALAARAVGAPLRLVLTRQEELLAATPAPASRATLKLAADADGKLTAIAADYRFDSGCFPNSPHSAAAMTTGSLYQCPNFALHGAAVLTHKPSTGAYRAPGNPQLAFALESTLDELARELAIDPIDLRLRNASRPGRADGQRSAVAQHRHARGTETGSAASDLARPRGGAQGRARRGRGDRRLAGRHRGRHRRLHDAPRRHAARARRIGGPHRHDHQLRADRRRRVRHRPGPGTGSQRRH